MAMYFNGSNQYVEIPHHADLNITDNITLSAWIYMTRLDIQWQMIFCKGFSGNDYSYYFMLNYDKFTVGFYDGGWLESISDPVFSLNTWYHVCGTFVTQGSKDTDLSLFVNGEFKVNNLCMYGNIIPNSSSAVIGTDAASEHFYGYVDDMRVYNRALSQGEIETLYACKGTDGIYDGMVGRWLLKEKECGAIANTSIINIYHNGSHGTAVNSPTYVPSILKFRRVA